MCRFVLFLIVVSCGLLSAAEKPNIVFLFSDDHALAAISAYGSHLKDAAPTPNLDRIAKEGALFRRSYCTNSICGPSRASILTGKHSHKNGFLDNEMCEFDGSQATFPKGLQAVGYETAIVGKWHLASKPTGFDYWEILPGQGSYYNPDFVQMDGTSKRFEGYCTDIVTDKALEWLKTKRSKDKPFLLMCQHKAPHRNWMPAARHYGLFKDADLPEPATLFDNYEGRSKLVAGQQMSVAEDFHWGHDLLLHGKPVDPRFLGGIPNGEYQRMTEAQKAEFDAAYGPENEKFIADLKAGKLDDVALTKWKYQRYIKNYLRCVRAVDENVGRVLAYLDEAGLSENTIVIYSSDQGFYLGEHGWYDKRWMFEESLSMPFLIRWPGVVRPGGRPEAMIQNIDYAPTFLAAAGAPVPEDIQGRNLLPVLQSEATPEDWRKSIYYAYYGENTHRVPMHDGVRTERHKLMFFPNSREWQLFDLDKDPQEMKSVHDDPAYSTVMSEMMREYVKLRDDYDVVNSVIPTQRMAEDWWRERFQQKQKQTRDVKECRVVFLGDSITQGWEGPGKEAWEANFAGYHPLNLGFSGDRTEHLQWRLKYSELDRVKPKVAVLLIGTNNTGHLQRPAEETVAGIQAVIAELHAKSPETKVILQSVLPRGPNAEDPLRKLNDSINVLAAKLADGKLIRHVDYSGLFLNADGTLPKELMPDLLHLSPAAYQKWAEALKGDIEKSLAE